MRRIPLVTLRYLFCLKLAFRITSPASYTSAPQTLGFLLQSSEPLTSLFTLQMGLDRLAFSFTLPLPPDLSLPLPAGLPQAAKAARANWIVSPLVRSSERIQVRQLRSRQYSCSAMPSTSIHQPILHTLSSFPLFFVGIAILQFMSWRLAVDGFHDRFTTLRSQVRTCSATNVELDSRYVVTQALRKRKAQGPCGAKCYGVKHSEHQPGITNCTTTHST